VNLINEDWFLPDFVPTDPDMSFYQAVVDERNFKLPNEYCPQRFVKPLTFFDNTQAEKYTPRLVADRQAEIAEWFMTLDQESRDKLQLGDNIAIGKPIEESSDLCSRALASNHLSLEVTNMADGFYLNYGVNAIEVNVSSQAGVEKVEYLLNDEVQYTNVTAPYNGSVRVPRVLPTNSPLKVTVRLIDTNGYMRELNLNTKVGNTSLNPSSFETRKTENFESLEISPIMNEFNEFFDGFGTKEATSSESTGISPQQPTSKVLEFDPNNFVIQ